MHKVVQYLSSTSHPNLRVLVAMASTSRESDEELIVSIDVVHDSGVSTIAELQR